MAIALGELVTHLGGQLLGDPALTISGIAPLDLAGPQHLSFLSNPKLRAQAAQSQAAALVLDPKEHALLAGQYGGACILHAKPYVYFAHASQWFAKLHARPVIPGVAATAVIGKGVQIAASAYIGPHVTIEDGASIGERVRIDAGCFIGAGAKIGADSHLQANVNFHAACEIGERGDIRSGAVIGSEGFGFANEGGQWIKIAQTGRVIIGNDVQIGANTCIDRGALADTIIEDGVKLDNLIQIGHNCRIGAHTAMAGCVGVAGSATIGRHCTFGGAAMVLGHLSIADHVHISSGSMVSRSIAEPGNYTGFYPLAKNADWEKSAVIVRNLSGMREKIRDLEKAVKSLTATQAQKHHE